ncbi:IclR family transcriptional regulator domain-containing protein [Sporosarcina limicola]|uniref:IclR family pca regulon transcriptional regulator n=1 Tax=Sporosarcina limicola TaxID=34101 RepID=A0A927MMN9_9BACL|nr:IclR family transcriptional regulator C-terminal domain-containing protein [Sporosarcina limicola]MBE1554304.1 IclR family pca regulon transcriptional regulator [Sporosarcina limicola]
MENSNNSIKNVDFIQSLERGLSVIQAFSQEYPNLTVSEAATITHLSRPAVRRILLTLESLGYVKSINGRFSLTARVLSLGYAYISSKKIWEGAHHHMKSLVEKTDESTSISVLDGTEIIYVARIPTKRIMTISLDVGSRLPAYATSMGQVLLAHLPPSELEDYLHKVNLNYLTEKTIIDKSDLLEQLNEIRAKGWGFIEQQLEEGLSSIAAPIKNAEGKVIAAINISTHAGRFNNDTIYNSFLPLLLQTAEQISHELSKSHHVSYL